MQRFVTVLLFPILLIAPQIFAKPSGHFYEELFVSDISAVKRFVDDQAFIVDHVSASGFELYGPKGTKDYLDMLKIKYQPMRHRHHKKARDYPSFNQIEKKLKLFANQNPKISRLFSIGKSVEGRNLWVLKISDNVNIDEVEPEFKYISSMHGDEITGRELCMKLIEDLLNGYGKNKEFTELINQTEIYIMPSMNPDGSALTQRGNANGYDLNRNFPDWKRGDANQVKDQQPETRAIMQFQANRNFSLSANFHGGAVVVNYPWDNTYKRHPLDHLVQAISLEYANLNSEMRNSKSFPRGITNGADWYKVYGGMQDWSYFWYGDLQVTVELSSEKWPAYRNINKYYQLNKASMLRYMKLIHQGFGFYFEDFNQKGSVVIQSYENKNLSLVGEFVFGNSEFYKVLPEGKYRLQVKRNGYSTIIRDIVIDDQIHPDGKYLKL